MRRDQSRTSKGNGAGGRSSRCDTAPTWGAMKLSNWFSLMPLRLLLGEFVGEFAARAAAAAAKGRRDGAPPPGESSNERSEREEVLVESNEGFFMTAQRTIVGG